MDKLDMGKAFAYLKKLKSIDQTDFYAVIAEGGVKISRKRYDQLMRVVKAKTAEELTDISLVDLLKLTKYVPDIAPFFVADHCVENAYHKFGSLRSHCVRRVL